MPVIILEAKDFTSPLFVVRTWEVVSGCITFSLVASLEPSEFNRNPSDLEHLDTFRNFCMFTWCFFFGLTLLIHILSIVHFHTLIPISWKNLTLTVAVFGALMSLSASVVYPWIVMDHQKASLRSVAAAVASCLTLLAYASESYVLCTQAQEQRGYMGSMPGLLKILHLWGGCQMMALIVAVTRGALGGAHSWQLWVSGLSYGACVLMSLVTLVVILGDFAARCFLPFQRFLAGFSVTSVLLYTVATVLCFTEVLQLRDRRQITPNKRAELVIMETVVASVTLLAYLLDLALSIKLLCDRSHV